MSNRAVSWEIAGDYTKSAAMFEQSLDILRKAGFADDHERVRTTEISYANTLALAGRFNEALPRLERLQALALKLDGASSMSYAMSVWYLTQYALLKHDPAHGLPLLKQAMTLWPSLVGEHHVVYALNLRWRGQFAWMQADLPLAEKELRLALARQQADSGSAVAIAQTRALLAGVLHARGNSAAAKRELAASLPVLRKALLPSQTGRSSAEALALKLGS